MGFEIAEAGPVEALVQVHFADDNASPGFGAREGFAILVPNGAEHPMVRWIFIGTADQIDVILTGTCRGEGWVASPNWPGDDFRSPIAQLPCDLRKEAIVANHHAEFPKTGIEYRIFVSGGDACGDFFAGQTDFAIFACDFTVGAEQDGDIVNEMPIAFDQSRHDIKVVLSGEFTKIFGGRAGNRFRALGET